LSSLQHRCVTHLYSNNSIQRFTNFKLLIFIKMRTCGTQKNNYFFLPT